MSAEAWRFPSTVVLPDGRSIEVLIAVPADVADGDVLENAELAAMLVTKAVHTLQGWDVSRARAAAREAEETAVENDTFYVAPQPSAQDEVASIINRHGLVALLGAVIESLTPPVKVPF